MISLHTKGCMWYSTGYVLEGTEVPDQPWGATGIKASQYYSMFWRLSSLLLTKRNNGYLPLASQKTKKKRELKVYTITV